jgi:glycosyltransferase involved in cell wall biosynthesis
MTHVLSIIHYPVFGGPHNRNMRVAPVLAARGIKTTVLLPDEPGNAASRLREAGVEVAQFPLGRVRASKNVLTHLRFFANLPGEVNGLRKLIKRLQVEVVQINGLANPHGALAARAAGVPVVWQILDTYTPILLRHAMAPLLTRFADAVMCPGIRVAEEHPGVMNHPERLISFFPPVDLTRFRADAGVRAAVQQELGVEDATLVVGTVGNINLQKGHDNFIRAAAYLKSKVPGAKFLILGAIHENHRDYIDSLRSLAVQLGLVPRRDLIALDPTGRVHEWVQAMDVFWMTPRPRSEGIPTAMEEAMALGVPVVSFDVGSISELVEHGTSGYIVRGQNPEAIARNTLEHLLGSDKRAAMGLQARRFVEEHASLEDCAKRHLTAYRLATQARRVPSEIS